MRAVKRDATEVALWQAEHGALGEWNDAIGVNWDVARERLWRARQAAYEAEKQARDADWRQRYRDHLDSPTWWDKRKQVLKRAGHKCEGCGDALASEVHHLTYEHMGDEFLFELIAVCRACHERLHGKGRMTS
ncbi:MAG: HNH endonuclease [Rhodospirillaceae bacterium]